MFEVTSIGVITVTSFIIHIGDGKCGSSSIQAALHMHAKALESNGILYKSTTPKNGHFNLVRLIGHKTRGDDASTLKQAVESVSLIQGSLSDNHTILLSAESFFTKTPEEVYSIITKITEHVEHIHIIAYVRPPHSMYLSLIQQQLKGSSTFVKPHLYRRPVDKCLEAWKSYAKTSSITVHNFDRTRLTDGDVVSDFSQVLSKITKQNIKLSSTQENVSLTSEQMSVLQTLRRKILLEYDGRLHPYSGTLVSYFEQLNAISPIGSKPQLSRSAFEVILKGNYDVVQNLNVIFPDLELCLPIVEDSAQRSSLLSKKHDGLVTSETASRDDSDNIDAILEQIDFELVGQLCSLVPQLNSSLAISLEGQQKEALLKIVSKFGIDKNSLLKITRSYWHRWGMTNAAAQLDALFM